MRLMLFKHQVSYLITIIKKNMYFVEGSLGTLASSHFIRLNYVYDIVPLSKRSSHLFITCPYPLNKGMLNNKQSIRFFLIQTAGLFFQKYLELFQF